jgi:two-component system, sensor histidine kinase and response regulator
MDVEMPRMDGLATTRAIREQEQAGSRHLPIVAMTAHALKGDSERFLAAGMDGYISKPIRAQDLSAVIESTLASAKNATGTGHPHKSAEPLAPRTPRGC